MGGLRYRVARLAAVAEGLTGQVIILHTLPGMTTEEALRLWFGPDRAAWPPSRSTFIRIVNALDLYGPLGRLGDIPDDFMEHREDLLFDVRWRRFCDVFDECRRQMQNIHGIGLMYKETDTESGYRPPFYKPVEMRFDLTPSLVN